MSGPIWTEQIPIYNGPQIDPRLIIQDFHQQANGYWVGDVWGEMHCFGNTENTNCLWEYWDPSTQSWDVKRPQPKPTAEDDRAKALGQAINNTGVQSLGNPCTVVLFYGLSAGTAVSFGSTAAGAEIFPELNAIIKALKATPLGKVLPYIGVASAGAKFAGFYNGASNAVQRGCNALQ